MQAFGGKSTLIHIVSLLLKMLGYDQVWKKEYSKRNWGCGLRGGEQASSSNRVVRTELTEKMRCEQTWLKESVKRMSGEDSPERGICLSTAPLGSNMPGKRVTPHLADSSSSVL